MISLKIGFVQNLFFQIVHFLNESLRSANLDHKYLVTLPFIRVRKRFASTCRLLAYPFVVEVPLSPQQIDLRFVARRASRCWRRSSSSHRHRSIFVGFFLLGVSIEFQVFCRTRQRFSQTRNSYALPPYQ